MCHAPRESRLGCQNAGRLGALELVQARRTTNDAALVSAVVFEEWERRR